MFCVRLKFIHRISSLSSARLTLPWSSVVGHLSLLIASQYDSVCAWCVCVCLCVCVKSCVEGEWEGRSEEEGESSNLQILRPCSNQLLHKCEVWSHSGNTKLVVLFPDPTVYT